MRADQVGNIRGLYSRKCVWVLGNDEVCRNLRSCLARCRVRSFVTSINLISSSSSSSYTSCPALSLHHPHMNTTSTDSEGSEAPVANLGPSGW
jgi:hypothetical protein